MNSRPYIGITGIENSNQLEGMLTTYSQKGDIPHLFMIGAIVSYKTLINVKDKPIVLMRDEIRDIFEKLREQPNEDILFALHYFTRPLEGVRAELKEKAKGVVEKNLYQQISELFEDIYGEYERTQPPFQLGVQINVNWPKPKDINQIKTDYPNLKTILQVSDFSLLGDKIGGYNVDYILIDASRGFGIELDIDKTMEAYNIITRNNPAMIGFAGGFSPENIKERVSFLREKLNTRDFCIDAEGRLRKGKYLDMKKVERYLKESIEAFQVS